MNETEKAKIAEHAKKLRDLACRNGSFLTPKANWDAIEDLARDMLTYAYDRGRMDEWHASRGAQ